MLLFQGLRSITRDTKHCVQKVGFVLLLGFLGHPVFCIHSAAAATPVGDWLAKLRSPEIGVRLGAACNFEDSGIEKEKTADLLAAALKDPDPFVRRSVVVVLGELQATRAPLVAVLVRSLEDPEPLVRYHAALALGKIGKSATQPLVKAMLSGLKPKSEAEPKRLRALDEPMIIAVDPPLEKTRENLDLADHAAFALIEIGPDSVLALADATLEDDELVGEYLSFIIRSIEDSPQSELVKTLRSTDIPAQRTAILVLLGFVLQKEEAAPDTLAVLRQAMQDRDANVRLQAIHGLAVSRDAAKPAVLELTALLGLAEDPIREAAVKALGSIAVKTPAVTSALAARLEDDATPVRIAAAVALGAIGVGPDNESVSALRNALRDKNSTVRNAAVQAWGRSENRVHAVAVIPALIETLGDTSGQVRESAAYTLGHIGMAAVPHLQAAFISNDDHIRRAAVLALTRIQLPPIRSVATFEGEDLATEPQISAELDSIVALLDHALHDKDDKARLTAAENLTYFYRYNPKAVAPLLLDALQDSSKKVRQSTLESLRYLDPPVTEALPLLQNLLSDPDPEIRLAAIESLRQLKGDATPVLLQALRDSDPRVRAVAIDGLQGLEDKPQSVIDALIPMTVDADTTVRRRALFTLFDSKNSDAVLSTTTRALKDQQVEIRKVAINNLARLGNAAQPSLHGLMSALEDPDRNVRLGAEYALGRVGASALPRLYAALDSQDAQLRRHAVAALGFTVEANPETIDNIKRLLYDEDKGVRQSAIRALVYQRTQSYPQLIEALSSDYPEVRIAALDGLSRNFPSQGSSFVEPLLKMVSDDNSQVRKHAIEALARIKLTGPETRGQALVKALSDEEAEVRLAAVAAIKKLGVPLSMVEGPLINGLDDPLEEIRLAIADTLLTLGSDPKKSGVIMNTILRDDFVKTYVSGKISHLADVLHPQEDMAIYYSMDSSAFLLPKLPWPLPLFSTWDLLPRHYLGNDGDSLGDVHGRLEAALEKAGFSELGLMEVFGGFALVSRVERIHSDGSSFDPPHRWTKGKIPLDENLCLREYLNRLFLEKPGQFRLFMFIVTTLDHLETSTDKLSEQRAREFFLSGAAHLPEDMQKMEFKGRKCYAVVYHFEKKIGAGGSLIQPSFLTASTHLQKAGIQIVSDL